MVSTKAKSLSKKDKGKMNDVLETHELFTQAFPERRFGSIKEMLNEAVKFIAPKVEKEFTHRRARAIWEKKARRIDGEEKDALRLAVIEEDRREQRELRARLAALDERLSTVDQEFHSPALAAYREAARRSGPQVR
jgi:hypothetical protein